MASTVQENLDNFFALLQEIKLVRKGFVNTIDKANRLSILRDTIDKHGMSKSLANYIKVSDIYPLLEKLDLDEYVNEDKHDYLYKHTEASDKIKSTLQDNIVSPTMIKRNCYETCNKMIKEAKSYLDQSLKTFTKQLSNLRKELSNTTKRGIPSKMEKCHITTYPVDDNKEIMLDKPLVETTMLDCGHDKDSIIVALDKAIEMCNSVAKEKVFLSENLDEMLETLNKYNKISKSTCVFVSRVLSISRKYKDCC